MKPLDCFYFLGSTYTYLSVCRADALAQAAGTSIAWRPYSARSLMREQENGSLSTVPQKYDYLWRDIERRAQRFGIPYRGIVRHPVDASETANHVATLAAMEGWCLPFTRLCYDAWFLSDEDPGDDATLRRVLRELGQDVDRVLARAAQADVHARYIDVTDRARALGLFGSPMFVSGTEVFWGDDRLEDALEWHVAHQPGGAADSQSRRDFRVRRLAATDTGLMAAMATMFGDAFDE